MKPKTKSRLIFWLRLIGWIVSGCVAPIVVFAVKFGLFDKSGYSVTIDELGNVLDVKPTALNGWGIIAVILICTTIIHILKEVCSTFTGYSFLKQCLSGFVSNIMPLITIFAVCYFLDGILHNIMYCLGVIIICRCFAVVLDPFPKWKYEKTGAEDYRDPVEKLIGNLIDSLKKKESETKEGEK